MSGQCCGQDVAFDGVSQGFRRVLLVVIAINATMFVVEMAAGYIATSQALQADALDFFGDTLTYAVSLAVIGQSLRVRSTAALLKGLSLGMMGVWIFGATLYQMLVLDLPRAEIMGSVGLAAFIANLVSVLLLIRYKDGDSNVRSVWLCSRNDAIGNIAVMIAAFAVYFTDTAWPDLLVAGFMAGLFLWSAVQIVRQALRERRHIHTAMPAV